MTQGWRAVGGKLVMDQERVGFAPHVFDRSTGGKSFDQPVTDLASISIAQRTFHPFDGGMRRRLRLGFNDGTEALFVVSKPAEVGKSIRDIAAAGGGSPRMDI